MNVLGDKAYDAEPLREQLRQQHCVVVIPYNRRTRTHKKKRDIDSQLYRCRHVVENYFQRLKRYRRIAMRYEKLAATFFAMVCFASILIWLL